MKKIALIIILTVLALGILVLSQKKNKSMYDQRNTLDTNAQTTQTQNSTTQTLSGQPITKTTTSSEIPLTVTQPTDGQHVTNANIVVKGTTLPNAEVEVNDAQTQADAQGQFTLSLLLDPGDNSITVVTNDPNGKYAEKDLTVTFDSNNTGL